MKFHSYVNWSLPRSAALAECNWLRAIEATTDGTQVRDSPNPPGPSVRSQTGDLTRSLTLWNDGIASPSLHMHHSNMNVNEFDDAYANERQAVPRVVHLGYFDAALEAVRTGTTFDELRLHLATVGRDLARYAGRNVPSRRTSPTHFWKTTRDTLLGLMQLGLVGTRSLPSLSTTVSKHGSEKYALTEAGGDLLRQTEAEQRDRLGAAMFRTYPPFRRYLERLSRGPFFIPEFTEGELARLKTFEGNWLSLSKEVGERLEVALSAAPDVQGLADEVAEAVRVRLHGKANQARKDFLDAVNDSVARYIAHVEGLLVDATSLNILHEWSRQLFLTGSSRYVAGLLPGLLHWSATTVTSVDGQIVFSRRTIPDVLPDVVAAMETAYRSLKREQTGLVEYYAFRATTAFRSAVCNEIIDRVVGAMVSGAVPNDLGLQPVAGAQWSPPPSENALRIAGRRYTLITCTQ